MLQCKKCRISLQWGEAHQLCYLQHCHCKYTNDSISVSNYSFYYSLLLKVYRMVQKRKNKNIGYRTIVKYFCASDVFVIPLKFAGQLGSPCVFYNSVFERKLNGIFSLQLIHISTCRARYKISPWIYKDTVVYNYNNCPRFRSKGKFTEFFYLRVKFLLSIISC